MAGTVAHTLNVPLMEALHLGERKLIILFNEARRQRALDLLGLRLAVWGERKDLGDLEAALKAHGAYTEGFYEEERHKLLGALEKRGLSGKRA